MNNKGNCRNSACGIFLLCLATAIASPAQTFTTLVNFDFTTGGFPLNGLVQAADGNFYGTNSGGNSSNGGTVYRITPGGTLTTLHYFCPQVPFCTDGTEPQTGLVQGADGNFYGTTLTLGGGYNGYNSIGTVFKITPGGTLTTLYTFEPQFSNGVAVEPQAGGQPNGLVQATDGNFYGTTQIGGAQGFGTVFKITPGGTLTTLHSFGLTDGFFPIGTLVQATDGNLYGTTSGGGINASGGSTGYGTIFKITPAGVLTTLHNFCSQIGCTDGSAPFANLVQATDGNFYGTTQNGGVSGNCPLGSCGTVFKITPGGALTTLHRFDGTDGSAPRGGLIQATDGNLYGTTAGCGAIAATCTLGLGTVFKITPAGTLTTLHSFVGSDGSNPFGGLVQATDGSFYGTTFKGGANDFGTVFRVSTFLLPQTIAFGALSNQALGMAPFGLSATASSGLPVVFASNTTSVCTISGTTVSLTATGTCSITASQAGNATYAAATPVTQSFTVSLASASLMVAPAALNFQIQQGAPAQSQSLQIGGTAGTAWQATAATSTGSGWLSVSPGSGQIPASLTAVVNATGLTSGTYQGNITIQGLATPPFTTINVTLTVTAMSGQSTIITTVAGGGNSAGDGGPATSASLFSWGVAVDASENLFIADVDNNRIRKVSASGIITTVAGNGTQGFSGDGGLATSASLNQPQGIAVDASGNLFIVDAGNRRIRKVSASGIITTVAGNGNGSFAVSPGDGGPATSAPLIPAGIAVDASGNLFIADTGNNRIRKVSAGGIITTVAGGGNSSFSGDGGPATSASLQGPFGIAVDASGNLFIADSFNNRIRKVSAGGIIATVAGSGNVDVFNPAQQPPWSFNGGFSGDGGPATSALMSTPRGIAVGASGNFFISDSDNNRIRQVSAGGIITTVAGSGPFGLINTGLGFTSTGGFSGDGGPATSATLANPFGVAVDRSGNLFIADGARIREVQAVNALGGIQNAASYTTGAVSPGEIVVLYGAGMGPAALATWQVDSTTGLLKTTVAGTTVSFNGTPAPIIYTSASQVSVIVPYKIALAVPAQILVNYQGKNVAAGTVPVAPSAPGIFTVNSGTGQAAALNQDGSVNSASNPAVAGSTIVLYLTGEGQTTPPGADGKIASAAPFPAPVLPVTVTIGGQPATYSYAGAAPGEVAGVMQINAAIPAGVTGNVVRVLVQIGNVSSQNGVSIAIQ